MNVYDKIISDSKQVVAEQLRIIAEAKQMIVDNTKLVEEATKKLANAKTMIDKHNQEELAINQIMTDRRVNAAKFLLTKKYTVDYLRKNCIIEPKYLFVTKYRHCECLITSTGISRDVCKCCVYYDKLIITKEEFYNYLMSPDTHFTKDEQMDGTIIKCGFYHNSSYYRVHTLLEFEFAIKIDDIIN